MRRSRRSNRTALSNILQHTTHYVSHCMPLPPTPTPRAPQSLPPPPPLSPFPRAVRFLTCTWSWDSLWRARAKSKSPSWCCAVTRNNIVNTPSIPVPRISVSGRFPCEEYRSTGEQETRRMVRGEERIGEVGTQIEIQVRTQQLSGVVEECPPPQHAHTHTHIYTHTT